MGRITDLLPALYHGGENDLTRFTDVLDIQVKKLERGVKGITDLINVDRCPDDKLPYLAAYINCPLIGDDPIFWRKQIRNWPYILRLKGTQRSLELVLDSLDIQDKEIKTFFRDERGKYVTDKPSGEPFIDDKGLWRNIRTHYFSIYLTLSKDFVESRNFDWDETEISEKLRFWLEHGKPYHSELLHLSILPPDFLPEGHIHYWDKCIWGHPSIELHDWGLLPLPVFKNDPLTSIDFVHGFNVISDTQLWDISTWGGVPYRELRYGQDFEHCIFANLNRISTATWFIPYEWAGFSWEDSELYSLDFETYFERGSRAYTDIKPLPLGMDYFLNMLADTQLSEPIYSNDFVCGILADLQRENTVAWFVPSAWEKFAWGEAERYSRDFELDFQRGNSIVDTDIKPQPFGRLCVVGMYASLQPYWDCYTWWQHKDWGKIFGIPRFAPGFIRDNKASVQWDESEAPYAKWSRFRTWGDSTWDKSPAGAGTWETGAWIDDYDLEEAV